MAGNNRPAEQFAALSAVPGVAHCFTTRVSGIDVCHDKADALRRLDQVHRDLRAAYGMGALPLVTAEQIHGKQIATIDTKPMAAQCFDGCDGLATNQPGVCLGIYVADCCAVYLVDPVRKAIALVHSGKKGTEFGIATNAVDLMAERFGSRPADLVAQLSPCIRPPHYEIDFAADIVSSLKSRGLRHVHDSGICTACDLQRYYSYRAEKGKTGRMLALLAML